MPDRYTISEIAGICYYLSQYRGRTDEWEADFYDTQGNHICNFSGDEETRQAILDDDSLYQMVTEMIDLVIMMGTEFVL